MPNDFPLKRKKMRQNTHIQATAQYLNATTQQDEDWKQKQ